MRTLTVKVGPENDYVIIPYEWELVKSGECKEGDMYCDTSSLQWSLVEEDDLGMPFDSFDALIRLSDPKLQKKRQEALSVYHKQTKQE